MASMSEIEWEPCPLTQRPAPELELRFERETGRPGRLMRCIEGSPWIADTLMRVSVQINTVVRIDPNLVDQAGLVVSQDNSCRFCVVAQRAFLRVLGMSEKRITQLEQALLTNDFTPPNVRRSTSHGVCQNRNHLRRNLILCHLRRTVSMRRK